MVLFQIDAVSVTVLELEGDAPRPVDVGAIALRLPAQRVEVEAGDIHIPGNFRNVQRVENNQHPFLQSRRNLGGLARCEKLFQALISNRFDHTETVALGATHCKQLRYNNVSHIRRRSAPNQSENLKNAHDPWLPVWRFSGRPYATVERVLGDMTN
jgi:hypothetical protein